MPRSTHWNIVEKCDPRKGNRAQNETIDYTQLGKTDEITDIRNIALKTRNNFS